MKFVLEIITFKHTIAADSLTYEALSRIRKRYVKYMRKMENFKKILRASINHKLISYIRAKEN